MNYDAGTLSRILQILLEHSGAFWSTLALWSSESLWIFLELSGGTAVLVQLLFNRSFFGWPNLGFLQSFRRLICDTCVKKKTRTSSPWGLIFQSSTCPLNGTFSRCLLLGKFHPRPTLKHWIRKVNTNISMHMILWQQYPYFILLGVKLKKT